MQYGRIGSTIANIRYVFLLLLFACTSGPEEGITRAEAYWKADEPDKAIATLTEVIAQHPGYLKAYTYKASYLSTLPGRKAEAISVLD